MWICAETSSIVSTTPNLPLALTEKSVLNVQLAPKGLLSPHAPERVAGQCQTVSVFGTHFMKIDELCVHF